METTTVQNVTCAIETVERFWDAGVLWIRATGTASDGRPVVIREKTGIYNEGRWACGAFTLVGMVRGYEAWIPNLVPGLTLGLRVREEAK